MSYEEWRESLEKLLKEAPEGADILTSIAAPESDKTWSFARCSAGHIAQTTNNIITEYPEIVKMVMDCRES